MVEKLSRDNFCLDLGGICQSHVPDAAAAAKSQSGATLVADYYAPPWCGGWRAGSDLVIVLK